MCVEAAEEARGFGGFHTLVFFVWELGCSLKSLSCFALVSVVVRGHEGGRVSRQTNHHAPAR